jgi:hypothetical protein
MSTMIDDYGSEADYDSEADAYDADFEGEGEGEDSEDARSDALRRRRLARARRLRDARVRMAREQARRQVRPSPPPSPPTPRKTVEAIRNLDLETKVGEDSLRLAIERANRRATRATYATVASVAIDQAFDTFDKDLVGHEFVRGGLRLTPLLLLAPQRRRPGIEGVVLDPRFIGAAAVAGLLAVDRLRDRDDGVDAIKLQPELDSNLPPGQLLAFAVNKKGANTGEVVTFTPVNQAGFQLDANGNFTFAGAVNRDTVVPITTTAGGVSSTVFLTLKP